MKKLLLLFALALAGIQLFAQSAKNEFVPFDFKWADQSRTIQTEAKGLKVAPYIRNSRENRGQTFNYSTVTYFIEEDNSTTTEKLECVITIKDDVINLFYGEEFLQNTIVSEYWTDNGVKVMKTLDGDGTVITYRQKGDYGDYFEIDIPGYTIRLEK